MRGVTWRVSLIMPNSLALSFVSYNMHGFNQGQNLLSSFCNEPDANIDFILLQETWLTPTNLVKLANFDDNYTFIGVSAMEQAVSQSILTGRPWGGVGLLMKSNLLSDITFQKCSERLVAVVYCNFLIINTYLPKINNDIDLTIV